MRCFLPGPVRLVLSVLFTLFVTTASFAQSPSDEDIHISAIAEFYAIHNYSKGKKHRALAVGPGGYWSNIDGLPSAAAARKAALNGCNQVLRTAPYKSLAKRRCVLFDLDGERTGKGSPVGIPFGTAASGPDLPYDYGGKWEATSMPRRGTLLLLHGCNKLQDVGGWLRSWINFYRASGFRVVLPNSFAEPRDPEMCGDPGEFGIDAQSRNVKLRIAQTLRTLATIRQKYPGEPIYVHGQSEGGYVAQALGEKLDGIIVTGAPCGFGAARTYRAGEGTPILFIAGTKDSSIWNARSAKQLASYCRKVDGDGKMTTVSVTGLGHYAALWWPGVRDAVSKFLKTKPITVQRNEAKDVKFPSILPADLKQYQDFKRPKVIAAAKTGVWSWYPEGETMLDSEEMALFACDEAAGGDAFLDTTNTHICVIVDRNGKRLVK